ncbi:hypothetical protein HUW46_02152 [Amycolatopsis sp. CA-230715]|nr:hypothetical protein HUW46_02152 [Amycolatopsis sp. CA-230715]
MPLLDDLGYPTASISSSDVGMRRVHEGYEHQARRLQRQLHPIGVERIVDTCRTGLSRRRRVIQHKPRSAAVISICHLPIPFKFCPGQMSGKPLTGQRQPYAERNEKGSRQGKQFPERLRDGMVRPMSPDWSRYYGTSPHPVPPPWLGQRPDPAEYRRVWWASITSTKDPTIRRRIETYLIDSERFEIWIAVNDEKRTLQLEYDSEPEALQGHRAAVTSIASTVPGALVTSESPPQLPSDLDKPQT